MSNIEILREMKSLIEQAMLNEIDLDPDVGPAVIEYMSRLYAALCGKTRDEHFREMIEAMKGGA